MTTTKIPTSRLSARAILFFVVGTILCLLVDPVTAAAPTTSDHGRFVNLLRPPAALLDTIPSSRRRGPTMEMMITTRKVPLSLQEQEQQRSMTAAAAAAASCMLNLRGGGGGSGTTGSNDNNAMVLGAGLLSVVAAIQAGFCIFAPGGMQEKKFGAKRTASSSISPELINALIDILGFKIATFGAVGIAHYLLDVDKYTSIGIGYIVGAIGVAGSLWIHTLPQKFGFTTSGLVMELMIHLVAAFALLVKKTHQASPACSSSSNVVYYYLGCGEKGLPPLSAKTTKVIASFGLANAIAGLFQPVSFAKFWGLTEEEANDNAVISVTRAVACAIAASCVTMLALLWDVSPVVATSFGSVILMMILFL